MKNKKNVTFAEFANKLDKLFGRCNILAAQADELRNARQDFCRAIGSPLPLVDEFAFPNFPQELSDSKFADAVVRHCASHDAVATMASLPRFLALVEEQIAAAKQRIEKLRDRTCDTGSTDAENVSAKSLLAKQVQMISALRAREVVILKVFFSVRLKTVRRVLGATNDIAQTLGKGRFVADDFARAGSLSRLFDDIKSLDQSFCAMRTKKGHPIAPTKEEKR